MEEKEKQYIIVRSDTVEILGYKVNKLIRENDYVPIGGVCHSNDYNGNLVLQAMTKLKLNIK